jgi:hypothetical protein
VLSGVRVLTIHNLRLPGPANTMVSGCKTPPWSLDDWVKKRKTQMSAQEENLALEVTGMFI